MEEGRRRFAELGNRRATATALTALGILAGHQGDDPSAAVLFGQSLALALQVDNRENYRRMPRRAGRHRDATRDTLRTDIGIPVFAHLRSEYDSVVTQTRAAVGDPVFDEVWDEGRRVPYERGVAEALDLVESLRSALTGRLC